MGKRTVTDYKTEETTKTVTEEVTDYETVEVESDELFCNGCDRSLGDVDDPDTHVPIYANARVENGSDVETYVRRQIARFRREIESAFEQKAVPPAVHNENISDGVWRGATIGDWRLQDQVVSSAPAFPDSGTEGLGFGRLNQTRTARQARAEHEHDQLEEEIFERSIIYGHQLQSVLDDYDPTISEWHPRAPALRVDDVRHLCPGCATHVGIDVEAEGEAVPEDWVKLSDDDSMWYHRRTERSVKVQGARERIREALATPSYNDKMELSHGGVILSGLLCLLVTGGMVAFSPALVGTTYGPALGTIGAVGFLVLWAFWLFTRTRPA